VWTDGVRIVVADRDTTRALAWSRLATANGVAADVVIGQSAFDLARNAATPSGLKQPAAVAFGGGWLFIANAGHNRVLGWKGIPTSNGAAAGLVLGQRTFTRAAANDYAQTGTDGAAASARPLSYPSGIALANDALIVATR
jgi:hypothetical protein